jgi:hypothetical protein
MSAAPSAHATILDFFMTILLLRAGVYFDYVAAPHRSQNHIPPRSAVSEQYCSLWTDDSDRYQLAI